MSEGGDRLVFEARTPKWRAALMGFAGLVLLTTVAITRWMMVPGLAMLCQGSWLSDISEPLTALGLLALITFVKAGFALWLVWHGVKRLRRPVYGKTILDESGIELQRGPSTRLRIRWDELLQLVVSERIRQGQRSTKVVRAETTSGWVNLGDEPNPEALLEALLARTDFVARPARGLFTKYVRPEAGGATQPRPGWLPPGDKEEALARRRSWAWERRGLLAVAVVVTVVVALSTRPSPTMEVTPTTRLVELPAGCEITDEAWRPGTSELAVRLAWRPEGRSEAQPALGRLALVRPSGEINYLTDWTEGLRRLAWSPDGKWLVCCHKRYRLDKAQWEWLDAEEEARWKARDEYWKLPSDQRPGPAPPLPPRSEQELALKRRGEADELWLLEVATGKQRVIQQSGPQGGLWGVHWAPSGKRVAACWARATESAYERSLWVASVDDVQAQERRYPLPENYQYLEDGAYWAPNESALLASAYGDPNPDSGPKTHRAAWLVADLSTGHFSELLWDDRLSLAMRWDAHWAKDSRSVYVAKYRRGGVDLVQADVASGRKTRLVRWLAPKPWVLLNPTGWAPDDRALAVQAVPFDELYSPDRYAVFLARGDGTLTWLLLPESAPSWLSWSRDGKWLAGAKQDKLWFIQVPEGLW